MAPSETIAAPYPSVDELRAANDALLQALPEETPESDQRLPPNTPEILEFIRRAVETGAFLDNAADRRATQGLIDYWTNNYPLLLGAGSTPMSERFVTRLKRFDAEAPGAAAAAAEAVIKALGSEGKELARAVLMHLVQLPEGATRVTAIPAPLATLLKLGDEQRVEELIERLIHARVLKRTSGNGADLIELQYESLIRQWPLLSGWIEGRVKFRDAALFWEQSGKNRGALLTAGLWDEVTAYGHLSGLETEFIAKSRQQGWQVRGVLSVIAAVILSLIALWVNASHQSEVEIAEAAREQIRRAQEQIDKITKQQTAILTDASATNEQKVKAVQSLLKAKLPITLEARTVISNAKFNEGRSAQAKFISATLKDVTFEGVALPNAGFSSSTLVNSTFHDTDLDSARFDDATIKSTTFSNVKLYRSIFDRALFCGEVQFLVTDVRLASFRDVTFASNNIPRFVGTPWWLIRGWNVEQYGLLRSRSSGADYKETQAFKDEYKDINDQVARTQPGSAGRAVVLNSKAWSLATYGLNLDEAEAASREGLAILKKEIAAGKNYSRDEGGFQDTLAYILMQQTGKMPEALTLLKEAVEKTKSSPDSSEVMFRLAVAQFKDDPTESLRHLRMAMDEKKYEPSHELHLLWDHVKEGEFRVELEQLIRKNRPPRPRSQSGCEDSPAPRSAG